MKKLHYYSNILMLATTAIFVSCKDDDDNSTQLESWRHIPLSTEYTVPANAERLESGVFRMRLDDNLLRYEIIVEDLKSGDLLTSAQIYAGDPLTNGSVILDLSPVSLYSGNKVTGSVTIRESLKDSLMNGTYKIYFSINSLDKPTGLLRGQINETITMALDAPLFKEERTIGGTVKMRLTDKFILYSNLTVPEIGAGDELQSAHLFYTNSNGEDIKLLTLCENASEFGMKKSMTLDFETYDKLLTMDTHIKVITTKFPAGIMRAIVPAKYPRTNPEPELPPETEIPEEPTV